MRKGWMVVTAFMIVLVWVVQAEAFCVYNKTDRTLKVIETFGGIALFNFRTHLESMQPGCCDWSDSHCNVQGGKTDPVSFDVSYPTTTADGVVQIQNVCNNVEIPACGWLEITGTDGNYTCIAHDTCG